MGFRFRKSIKIVPGVKLNIGGKSAGLSVGNKYSGISFNSKRGVKVRGSIPGTGVSYSQKVGKSKSSTLSHKTTKEINYKMFKQPVPRRLWFIILAALFLISGVISLIKEPVAAIVCIVMGAVMLFFTVKTPAAPKLDEYQVNRQLTILDESIKTLMSTLNPETFFNRYADAENAANILANMTNVPIFHNQSPQELLEMLNNDKTITTNAFLDRYAKEIRMKAFELTRGRKAKIDSFKLITSEYADKMTKESIQYCNSLYEDMVKKIEAI